MTAKVFIAILGALCAAQIASAVFEQEVGSPWWTPSAIIKEIGKLLETVEKKIDEIDTFLDTAITNEAEKISDDLQKIGRNWENITEEWVEKAKQVEKDISECVKEQETLQTVLDELRNDTVQCFQKRLKDVKSAEAKVTEMKTKVLAAAKETKQVVDDCLAAKNPINGTLCLIEKVPDQAAKILGLDTKLTALSAIVGAKVLELGPLGSLCVADSTAKRTSEALSIVDSTVSCIQDKLKPSKFTYQ